jgi:DNA-directed RNA polymerase subunit K/omega
MYETITIMAKRANQINSEIKRIDDKLEEYTMIV